MKVKLAVVSIILSLAGIISTLFVNYTIAQTYKAADGKTKAMFGITEQTQFGYQYYFSFFGILAIYVAIRALKPKASSNATIALAFILAVICIALVFVRVWRLFV